MSGAVEQVVEKVVGELAAALGTVTVGLGVRAGWGAAMAGAGSLTPAELAERVGSAEPYVREWLKTQAAAGYVRHADGRFELPEEVAAALVHGPGGAMVDACTRMLAATGSRFDAFDEAFRVGRGFGWHERAAEHWHGIDQLTRATIAPGFLAPRRSGRWTGSRRRSTRAARCSTWAAVSGRRRS